ncbi:MAG TPA: sigma-54-dependent Fis family transcriptional regulator [Calditrichaeota bacterium]|nr:sigma-54-dependent Fis family transcriptional regulator [Calditrichota bacterium]
MNKRILLIDDNEDYCRQVQKTLALRDMEVAYFTNGVEGLENALQKEWGAILLDVYLNQELDGLELLKRIVEDKSQVPVIMISGASTLQIAVEATKKGAYDFLEKPIDVDRLVITINRALEKYSLTQLSQSLMEELGKGLMMVGRSASLKKVLDDAERIAQTDSKVLISGESGVGKDIIAKIIHYKSKREDKPFVPVNCAAIPTTLVETELFGYVEGAFTGAKKSSEGLIAQAEGGSLFLDEIGELPNNAQAKLLLFLNDGTYTPVGSTKSRQSNIRIIAATNKNIEKEIELGRFRQDLYYRLNVFRIHIPALRERPEDIEPLAVYFLERGCQKFGKRITYFSDEALDFIGKQRWQGNVRQLKSAVYRMVLLSNENVITYGTAATAIQMDRTQEMVANPGSYKAALDEFEKLYFLNQLTIFNWDLSKVAEAVGFTGEKLENKLKDLGLMRQKERQILVT